MTAPGVATPGLIRGLSDRIAGGRGRVLSGLNWDYGRTGDGVLNMEVLDSGSPRAGIVVDACSKVMGAPGLCPYGGIPEAYHREEGIRGGTSPKTDSRVWRPIEGCSRRDERVVVVARPRMPAAGQRGPAARPELDVHRVKGRGFSETSGREGPPKYRWQRQAEEFEAMDYWSSDNGLGDFNAELAHRGARQHSGEDVALLVIDSCEAGAKLLAPYCNHR